MKKLIVFAVLLLGLGYGWYRNALQPVNAADTAGVRVTIPAGAGLEQIANLLKEKDAIRSPFAFQTLAKLQGIQSKLQAGSFLLKRSLSSSEVLEVLTSGAQREMKVTIPEGFTVSDIDALMVREGLAETGAILRCAQTCDFAAFDFLPKGIAGLAKRGGKIEGYVFPDTYFVSVDAFDPQVFLGRMLSTFKTKMIDPNSADIRTSGRTLHELVTMASLLEEETVTDGERATVSGILWKRYDDKRGLGVDATVRYILNKPSADITLADLNTDSQYNTRKYRGLPPGPIASAGVKSFEAALHPKDSPYWYYLHDNGGTIHYATTNEEHNINRMTYLD